MNPIVLRHKDLTCEFIPSMGMALTSFKRGDLEVMAQSTRADFEKNRAGLGPLIGPHFLSRKLNPQPDPYLHGIARYVPWKYTATENSIHAILKGSDEVEGKLVKDLEGQDFTMRYDAILEDSGLKVTLSIVSDTDSLVGTHYYYRLPEGGAIVRSKVKPICLDQGVAKTVPDTWKKGEHELEFDLEWESDYTFHPYPNPLKTVISLDTPKYVFTVGYKSPSEENGWQLWHPKGADFVCIEPMSASNPRTPNLSVSSLQLTFSIDKK
jgi:galactose mutarotase-like enzyme